MGSRCETFRADRAHAARIFFAALPRAPASASYDANGNLTGDGSKTYTWNAKNQLTAVSAPAASFSYDLFGRRQGKTVAGAASGFLYDGPNVVQEQGSATVNLLTGLAVDETLSRTDGAGARSLLTDALGSTLALTDVAGTQTTSYTYQPYGAVTTTGAASTNPFQYTGRENDGTGLYYYRARYYSPTLHRFISEDPIGLGGGVNVYGYAYQNPVSNSDPTGEVVPVIVVFGGVGAAIGGVAGAISNWDCDPLGEFLRGALVGGTTGALGAFGGGLGNAAFSFGLRVSGSQTLRAALTTGLSSPLGSAITGLDATASSVEGSGCGCR